MRLFTSHFRMGLCAFAMLFTLSAFSQNRNIWTDVSESSIELTGQRGAIPSHYRTLHLDGSAMKQLLAKAPHEPSAGVRPTSGLRFSMPMPDGTFSLFSVYEINIMHPELAAKFPEIKTYAGQGIDDGTGHRGQLAAHEAADHAGRRPSPERQFFVLVQFVIWNILAKRAAQVGQRVVRPQRRDSPGAGHRLTSG